MKNVACKGFAEPIRGLILTTGAHTIHTWPALVLIISTIVSEMLRIKPASIWYLPVMFSRVHISPIFDWTCHAVVQLQGHEAIIIFRDGLLDNLRFSASPPFDIGKYRKWYANTIIRFDLTYYLIISTKWFGTPHHPRTMLVVGFTNTNTLLSHIHGKFIEIYGMQWSRNKIKQLEKHTARNTQVKDWCQHTSNRY